MVTTAEYSVSGIPNYSESRCKRFKLNSENLSPFWFSNKKRIVAGSSSHYMVKLSSLEPHFTILTRFSMEIPRDIGRSQRKEAKPDSWRKKDTKATCDESMACMERPVLLTSKLTDLTRSFRDSIIFRKTCPSYNLASNI